MWAITIITAMLWSCGPREVEPCEDCKIAQKDTCIAPACYPDPGKPPAPLGGTP